MTVTVDERYTAKNYTLAANVAATWGIGPRTITSITIHWWGDPVGQTYAGILDWFCNPKSAVTTSAHYVVSAGQAACIVSPWDAAWHAGSAYGNVHSIGIECNPRCSPEDYGAVADVVAQLRKMYGNLPLHPHNYWTSTTCPGDYRIDKIDALATGILSGQSTTVTPIGGLTVADINTITAQLNDLQAKLADIVTSGGTTSLRQFIADGTRAAQTAAAQTADINRGGAMVSLRQEVADAKTAALANSASLATLVARPAAAAATVDVPALAAALKNQLGAEVVAAIAAQWAK